ncbi:CASP8-associated protein 2-like [Dendronephthya gigantea]|uniref:CASP8-associated protein 2-like n=1 Tax=Dendronephthya gigantea TaxID=151771 RepID=UPI00106C1D75|nr:CASP8-associated protein 2-like [Dendronephthya gigantea]
MEEPLEPKDEITDVDLYGDLEFDVTKQVSFDEMKAKCEVQASTIIDLEKENLQLREQNEILKTNISSLYLTARNEVTRKDAEIKRLQEIEVKSRKYRHIAKDNQGK